MFPKETKILVVDDMVGMRKMVKGILQELGFKNISEAENGKTACEEIVKALASKEPFNLILSDWNMPVMQGIEILRFVRSTPEIANVPFLLVTAEGQFHQVKEAMALKVSEFVVKPFTPATLKAKLETVWKRSQTPAPAKT